VSAPPPPPWPPRLDTWLDHRRADSTAPLAIEVLAAKEAPKPGTARIAEHAQRALHPCSAHRMQSDASYVARRIADYEQGTGAVVVTIDKPICTIIERHRMAGRMLGA
jgi:hypothetical protein